MILLLTGVVLIGTFILREPGNVPANTAARNPVARPLPKAPAAPTPAAGERDALAAFAYTYVASDHIDIGSHLSRSLTFTGSLYCAGEGDGGIEIDAGTTLYGQLSSLGSVSVGAHGPARVFGNVLAREIDIGENGEVGAFENLDEREADVDLNGDGDARDFGVGETPLRLEANTRILCAGRSLKTGDYDNRIGDGMVTVEIGVPASETISIPRPSFIAYYELTTGRSDYPPGSDHVTSEIPGDGDGHYFASADAFIDYLDFQTKQQVWCWRCAGDGAIGPLGSADCPSCGGTGRELSVEISGVFYVDDEVLDLSDFGANLVVHGTIVVAQGDPYSWPARTVAGAADEHLPSAGSLILFGPQRMHFTQTYRSRETHGHYDWHTRSLRRGEDTQTIAIDVPDDGDALVQFPAIVAASTIEIGPRQEGFASHPGDIGDERLTVLQGVVFAGDEVRLHGDGGYNGEDIVFDETLGRPADDALDEAVLGVDLNDDGDLFDRVDLPAISSVPVIEVGDNSYAVDLNNDGVLEDLRIGADYAGFFQANGYALPFLLYQEGTVVSRSIHSCEQVLVVHDALARDAGMPYGFHVGDDAEAGIVSWRSQDVR